MCLTKVLNQLVGPWEPVGANAMTPYDWTRMQLTKRVVFLEMAIEIVFTSKSPQLPIVSEAAGVRADPRFPVIWSAKLLAV